MLTEVATVHQDYTFARLLPLQKRGRLRRFPVQRRVIAWAVHILAWLALLSLPVLLRPSLPFIPGFRHRHAAGINHFNHLSFCQDFFSVPRTLNSLLLIGFFYFNYFIAVPRIYFRRRRLLYGLCIGGMLAIVAIANSFMMPWEDNWLRNAVHLFGPEYNLFLLLLVLISSFAMALYRQWRLVAQQQLHTEISFLKAQINPHFLFNTLNSIYSLTITQSDAAPGALVKLSGMMRYTISETDKPLVSLDKELAYISDYVALQQLRLPPSCHITYSVNGDLEGLNIAPFLLIPFVENAFRYGVNPAEASVIHIAVNLTYDGLVLEVTNSKVMLRHKDGHSGLSLHETRHRLQQLYPGRHRLFIENVSTRFSIKLQLTLQ